MHVLLAGDFSPSLRARLREILGELGAGEILEARTNDEARAAIRVLDFDLAVVDLNMPVRADMESLPQLRRRGRLHVPVVVILTYSDPIHLLRARKLGVHRCQSATVSLEGLRSIIDAALGLPNPCATVGAGELP
jgi:DNA-binding NarL/FixJ family response regulator